ncbi:hypothetical protein AURDEDRAFT_117259 [Auricularia subglabra TFB-10046 SS5]|nr:hypothetical protein AURDEDRAFT_117259 [Auricularia subglabra TFB-10046 SS5]
MNALIPLALAAATGLVAAQEGAISGPTTSHEAMHYSCDPTKCRLPSCACASTSPPGGLSKDQVPQFVLFTADDAIQTYTIDAVNSVLKGRKNPNGCPVPMTYFNSIQYTNMSLVTDFYVAGNEVADHTMTHVGDAPSVEIVGNLRALNAFAGIPLSSLTGFRAPFLNYSNAMLQRIKAAEFTYDSSSTSSVPVTDPHTDAFWPYTLDNGLANDCLTLNCGTSGPAIPGLWEIPMYALFDEKGAAGPHLMDPWLDAEAGGKIEDVVTWMQNTFNDHYKNANRQPFGIYTHPIHFASNVPGQPPQPKIVKAINDFLDWVQQQQDVWLVTNAQLIAWSRNPVPVSQLNSLKEFQCQVPKVDGQVCNGIPANEQGLLDHCPFSDFPWHTCYGCPVEQPSLANPVPNQDTDGKQARFRLPANCSTPFWDPIAGKCLCNSNSCKFDDATRPIGPNGQNLTGGGTGTGEDEPQETRDPYTPFNAAQAAGAAGVLLGTAAFAALVGVF